MAAAGSARIWFEYVESDANVADGPSRLGMAWEHSPLARTLGCTMVSAALPSLSSLASAPRSALEAFEVSRTLVADAS